MNVPSNRHGNFHHRHNAGFWPASTLRVICLDEAEVDSGISYLQSLFPSDSFSLSSTSGDGKSVSTISQDSLLTPFELDTSSHSNVRAASTKPQNRQIPTLISILSSLPTPITSNTTKTHKRNKKMRGSFSFGDLVSDESKASQTISDSKRGFMPSSSPFHPLFPRQVHDKNRAGEVALGVIPEPKED